MHGCYVNALLELYGQDNKYGKRINASLKGIQLCVTATHSGVRLRQKRMISMMFPTSARRNSRRYYKRVNIECGLCIIGDVIVNTFVLLYYSRGGNAKSDPIKTHSTPGRGSFKHPVLPPPPLN